jgi:hypothetical protein
MLLMVKMESLGVLLLARCQHALYKHMIYQHNHGVVRHQAKLRHLPAMA